MLIKKKSRHRRSQPLVEVPRLLTEDKKKEEMKCNTSIVEFLKKGDTYSQREVSKRMERPRSYMRRVERVDWREISLGEFLELAVVFEEDPRKIISSLQYAMNGRVHPPSRRSLDKPDRAHLLNGGIRCMPLIENQGQVVLSVFYLDPHASCDSQSISQAGLPWLLALRGTATIEMGPESYVLKEREFLHSPKPVPYQLYNPSPSSTLCLLTGIQKNLIPG